MERSQSLAVMEEIHGIVANKQQVALLKATSPLVAALTDPQLIAYLYECTRLGANPLDGMIYPIIRGGVLTLQAGIHYLRARCEEAGDFVGIDRPQYEETPDGKLKLCRVAVYRRINGVRTPFEGEARFSEYGGTSPLWKDKPYYMLAKCAEAIARRLGWPQKLSKVYVAEEFNDKGEVVNGDYIDVTEESKVQPEPETYVVKPAAEKAAPTETRDPEPAQKTEPVPKAEPVQEPPPAGAKAPKATGPKDCITNNPFTCEVSVWKDHIPACTDGKTCHWYNDDLKEH